MASYWADCKTCGAEVPSGEYRLDPFGHCDTCRAKLRHGMTEDEVRKSVAVWKQLNKALFG